MSTKTKKKDKSTSVKTGNSLSIENISEIYQHFLNSISKNEIVNIESETIENIDLTGVQFLLYAKKIESITKTKVNFNLKFSENVSQFLAKTGFSNILNTI